ncbi:MAG: hypothetical protein QW514_05415 [Thermoprotei archaeon]
MSKRTYTYRRRLCVKEVRSFLKEIFGEYITNIIIHEAIGHKSDAHKLSHSEVRALIACMDELFGCCGEVLYQLMEFEEELSV